MIHGNPELSGLSMICLGSFNPQIFQPAWFAAQGLIRPEEVDDAQIAIVHPEVVAFSVEWMQLEAQRERLALSTTLRTEAAEAVRDLAVGVLTLLSHTPVYAVGINVDGHYLVDEREEFDRLGWALVPQAPWEGMLERPGVRALTVEGLRSDAREGMVRVTVEPSLRVTPHAVYIAVNDHYQLASAVESAEGTEAAVEVLKECWEGSIERSETVAKKVLEVE